jgi:hypothetical protein
MLCRALTFLQCIAESPSSSCSEYSPFPSPSSPASTLPRMLLPRRGQAALPAGSVCASSFLIRVPSLAKDRKEARRVDGDNPFREIAMLSALSKRLGAVSLSGVVPRAAASATAATLRPQAPAVGACVVAALQGRGASFWGLGGSSSSSTASAGVPLAAAKGAGVRGIATTPVCRAGMNDFYISRPQIDKDGNPIFPAVGEWRKRQQPPLPPPPPQSPENLSRLSNTSSSPALARRAENEVACSRSLLQHLASRMPLKHWTMLGDTQPSCLRSCDFHLGVTDL